MLTRKTKSVRREKFDLGYDMKFFHKWVADKQELIARAKRNGNMELALELGREIVQSLYGRVIAVQIVSSNTGARSPGLSYHAFKTNKDYELMVKQLGIIVDNPGSYKAQPLDRIYIPKADGRKRPISIPSYTDRCLQALYKLGLEPISEEYADPSSYGFRPIRSNVWATGRVQFNLVNPLAKYGYVVEVDIKSCFDNISHAYLTKIIPLVPSVILKEWLNCGYVERDDSSVQPTSEGVPQGGILSPLMTNLTLDGLEKHITNRILEANTGSRGAAFCRYADDMVVFVTTERNAEVALNAIKEFLKVRDLEVKEAKTRIVDLSNSSFVFLGFEYKRVFKNNMKRPISRVGIPHSAVRKFRDKIHLIMNSNQLLHAKIDKINQVARGWANYYKFAHTSIYQFRGLRYWLWKMVYNECYRITKNQLDKAGHLKIHEAVMSRYFRKHESYNTWPVLFDKSGKVHILFDISTVEYTLPTYTNKAQNPFILEDREILDKVSLKLKPQFRQKVLEKWDNKCALCSKHLDLNAIPYELHHVLPKRFGGKDLPKNLAPLCRNPCHKLVSSAILTKDSFLLSELIKVGVLNLPDDFLKSITPITE